MRIATVCFAAMSFVSVANAQLRFPKPKIDIKPPTVNDIERELKNAEKEVKIGRASCRERV